jgi:3-(3-hydroxy-phenyl)propionate hydroxylase
MFNYQTYPFSTPKELTDPAIKTHPVVIVGAGPVGLTLALALAKQGVSVVVLDESNQVSEGSRAICFAKRSLEIFDKLGVAKRMIDKGVKWDVGRIFFREDEIDRFDLSPEKHSKYPAFINLQQYYVEQFLIDAVLKEENIDVRWLNKVKDVNQGEDSVRITIETSAGEYELSSSYLVAADGSRSQIRRLLDLEMQGERFEERFLIADFKMEADFPSERWFWFDPPFAPGQSILLHKQPDNLWRLDFKLGTNADPTLPQDKVFLREKIKSVVGDRDFELDWSSIYSFSSKKLERFVHDRIIFVGDSAHVVSPFGARGANSGIEDADNLSWKLAAVLQGNSDQLLETYNAERVAAADQNIACTGQSNTFIAPQGEEAIAMRNLILENAKTDVQYKKQINCGRLSIPCVYGKYPASEEGRWDNANLEPGRAVKDCLLESGYLIDQLGYHFTVFHSKNSLSNSELAQLEQKNIAAIEIDPITHPSLVNLYELADGGAYLFTPDQYILGRWKTVKGSDVLELIASYLAGNVFEEESLIKTEQELIDEAVAHSLRNCQQHQRSEVSQSVHD